MWKIKLNDSTTLSNLGVNGTYFISPIEIDTENLSRNLAKIEIIAPENLSEYDPVPPMGAGVHEHVELTHTMTQDNNFWFSLRKIPPEKLKEIQRDANIIYLAMMSDIELPA